MNIDSSESIRNRFYTTYHKLPIKNYNFQTHKVKEFADTIIFLDWTANLPARSDEYMLKAGNPTLIYTNVPSPDYQVKLENFEMVLFEAFVNNYKNTPMGLSTFSYNNKLMFAISADKAAIPSVEDLGEILNGMVLEILSMAEKNSI